MIGCSKCWLARAWCRRPLACAMATTKHRSKNSSSGVLVRLGSSGRRATIGHRSGRLAVR